ncbi:unnamed protein product [Ceratitis capitata]|uniref:(Mediterranean fruit fly) hypothetical protein n=1 Tax=Ceratitis capitata TaxID=7213 RepID=A0A811UB51_CERCA|nr:unnamed protein product [Ceratitis capitata]
MLRVKTIARTKCSNQQNTTKKKDLADSGNGEAVYVRGEVVCVRDGSFGAYPKTFDKAPNRNIEREANIAVLELKLMQKEVELLKLQKSCDTVRDIVPVFDGGDDSNAWYSQVRHYRKALKLRTLY